MVVALLAREAEAIGIYLNPGNEPFARVVENDIYVDKTGLIQYMNDWIGKEKHLTIF